MSQALNFKQDKDRVKLFEFITFAVLISVLLILLYVFNSSPTEKGELADSDCYMHLIRASELYHTGRWYNPVIVRINAPYGARLHWTRPFDILLLLGAVPIGLFTDFESALFWWGVVVTPILMIVTLVFFQWSTRPILSKDGPFLAGLMFVFHVTTFICYLPGRPDHHSLLTLLFVVSVGLTLRIILRPFKARLCYIAGTIGALSLWVSVESLLLICTIFGVLSLLWILENGDFLRKGLHYSLTLFTVTGLAMFFERPWHDLATKEFDRLSIVHWTILCFIAVVWLGTWLFDRYTSMFGRRSRRLSFALLGVATLALAIWLCFPKFYKGPFVDIDPKLIRIWLSKIGEVQPLLSRYCLFCIPMQVIGTAIVGFAFLFYQLFWNSNNEKRKGWIYVSVSLIAFLLVSLYQRRWSIYTQILSIVPVTGLMCSVLARLRSQKSRVLVVMIFCLTFLVLGLSADMIFKRGASGRSYEKISLIQICGYLNQTEKWSEQKLRILTYTGFGAEILYRTRHEVIGTLCSALGISDTYDIMTADTDEKALDLIEKREINLILLCPKSGESAFYSRPEATSTFYQRLRQGMIPHWLQKVELPPDLSSSFILFEIM